MHLNISSAKWRPFCPGGDELTATYKRQAGDCVAVYAIPHPVTYYEEVKMTLHDVGYFLADDDLLAKTCIAGVKISLVSVENTWLSS